MSDSTVTILVLGAVGCGVVGVLGYHIVRFLRGSIKLSLPRTGYNAGDTIRGSFELHAKKPIQGNKLTATLTGVQVTKTFKDGKTQTQSHEVYRDERIIEDAREYPAGHKATHEFEIPVPNSSSPAFLNSALGRTLTAALRLLDGKQTHIDWKVEVRLDAKGIDLAAYKRISVNMPREL